jgi:hypothetical protein
MHTAARRSARARRPIGARRRSSRREHHVTLPLYLTIIGETVIEAADVKAAQDEFDGMSNAQLADKADMRLTADVKELPDAEVVTFGRQIEE